MKIEACQSPLPSKSSLRGAVAHLADELEAGRVYRREDLARMSTAVDRHLRELLASGRLKKLAHGLYYAPKQSNYGPLPPADERSSSRSWPTDGIDPVLVAKDYWIMLCLWVCRPRDSGSS